MFTMEYFLSMKCFEVIICFVRLLSIQLLENEAVTVLIHLCLDWLSSIVDYTNSGDGATASAIQVQLSIYLHVRPQYNC